MDQPKLERDVVIGDDAVLVAGMEIGDRCVIGARLGGARLRSETRQASLNTRASRKAMRRFGKRMSCRALPRAIGSFGCVPGKKSHKIAEA